MVAKFEDSVAGLPMREAVRYTTKNLKWTAADVKVRLVVRSPGLSVRWR